MRLFSAGFGILIEETLLGSGVDNNTVIETGQIKASNNLFRSSVDKSKRYFKTSLLIKVNKWSTVS